MTMTSRNRQRRAIVSSIDPHVNSNSLDWDSPSTVTGTVKRRPNSTIICSSETGEAQEIEKYSKIPAYTEAHRRRTKAFEANRAVSKSRSTTKTSDLASESFLRLPNASKSSHFGFNSVTSGKRGNLPEYGAKAFENRKSPVQDDVKWIPLSDVRSVADYKSGKTGKVSDSDSGIASPLSPGSGYGFVGIGEKEDRNRRQDEIRKDIQALERCTCVNQQVNVSFA